MVGSALNRREWLLGAATSALASETLTAASGNVTGAQPSVPTIDKSKWMALDQEIHGKWASYISSATEDAIRKDSSRGLIFLPFPYVSPTAPGSVYQFMFGWDTDFVSRALIV